MNTTVDTVSGSDSSKIVLDKIPGHVGIIMDGNRRFAKRLGLDPRKGHEFGEKKLEKLLEWCKEFSIKEITLYTFSLQNFNRPKPEFDYIMNLFVEGSKRLLKDSRLDDQNIRIRFIGRRELFSKEIQTLMAELEERTKNNKGHFLNFAMAYGGREELVDAFKEIAAAVKAGKILPEDIDEALIDGYVYNPSKPDLIIRTGGEHRTSNFLLWQSAYAEFIFLEKFWPEFEKEEFLGCLLDYAKRDRRIGK